MNIELLNKMKDYIEDREHTIDWEWGDCRTIEELIAQGAMPEIWHEVCAAIRARNVKMNSE